VIWGSDRPKFGEPEVTYRGKSVCVTGQIKEYRDVPEVVVTEPEQIKPTVSRENVPELRLPDLPPLWVFLNHSKSG
jgi:DNA/RNA endonuclease YhcR with UshA esterase domain